MSKIQRLIAWFLIPKGYYCEGCPFWFLDSGRPKRENGYCSYLGKGDWDINAEYPDKLEVQKRQPDGTYKSELVDKSELMPMSLLWDKVKGCNKR